MLSLKGGGHILTAEELMRQSCNVRQTTSSLNAPPTCQGCFILNFIAWAYLEYLGGGPRRPLEPPPRRERPDDISTRTLVPQQRLQKKQKKNTTLYLKYVYYCKCVI